MLIDLLASCHVVECNKLRLAEGFLHHCARVVKKRLNANEGHGERVKESGCNPGAGGRCLPRRT